MGVAIDAALRRLEPAPTVGESPLSAAFEEIGFIGCIESDEHLSMNYKAEIDSCDRTEKTLKER